MKAYNRRIQQLEEKLSSPVKPPLFLAFGQQHWTDQQKTAMAGKYPENRVFLIPLSKTRPSDWEQFNQLHQAYLEDIISLVDSPV